jgi:hypothetical protein
MKQNDGGMLDVSNSKDVDNNLVNNRLFVSRDEGN